MKSGVEIILSKLSKLVLPYDTLFKIENHIYHWIHSHKQRIIHKELLYSIYKKEFPQCTPIVVACEKGRLEDLKIFIAGHRGSVKKLLEEVGTDSYDNDGCNTLMVAAIYEKPEIIDYLLNYGADPTITNSLGYNALHWSARYNYKSTRITESLLKKMPLESINKKDRWGRTPLDHAYYYNGNPIQNDIVQLIRQHGGKANWYDRNGGFVEPGKGDLND